MQLQSPVTAPELSARAIHILESAERCFARNGFHRATMQDVAREAAMSPGNLYRYFPSKSEMVAGLIARDRAMVAEKLEIIKAQNNFRDAFLKLCWSYLAHEPQERIALWIEIWAEATHNPDIASLTARCDEDNGKMLFAMFENAKVGGQLPPQFDSGAFLDLLLVMSNGLLVQRALLRGFDPERALAQIDTLLQAAVQGTLALPPRAKDTE